MNDPDHQENETDLETSERRKVLVTGATGTVGRHVVSQLLRANAEVRALTRDPDSATLPDGVNVVEGDLSEPETLDPHLDGVDVVFLVWPLQTAETAPAVLETVAEHTNRLVYLSSAGVRDDLDQQPNPINQFHADIEESIEQAGLEWTILRSSGFVTNVLRWVPQIRSGNVVREPYGDAARSLIHERDIAAVAARVLTGDGHDETKYVLTGPESLTQTEQVETIGEVIDRPLRWEEVSPETMREQLLADMPPAAADAILTAHAEFVTEPEVVTQTVEDITGTQARPFSEWVRDHAGDFQDP